MPDIGKLHVGTSGYAYKPWKGTFYPEKLPDKETVFYQDPSINAALGICVLGNKVIVSDSPNVFVLTDTDGDGKADKRELLFTGISGKDHDHGVLVHAHPYGQARVHEHSRGAQIDDVDDHAGVAFERFRALVVMRSIAKRLHR